MFRSFQIINRQFRRSLLKLLHIHDLVRFCKQGVLAASCCVGICCRECSWRGVRRMLRSSIRRTPTPTQLKRFIPFAAGDSSDGSHAISCP